MVCSSRETYGGHHDQTSPAGHRAVETNLLGRVALPPSGPGEEHLWPFQRSVRLESGQMTIEHTEEEAEIVAAFVSDLDEAGALKFVLRGWTGGVLKTVYHHGFVVKDAVVEDDMP